MRAESSRWRVAKGGGEMEWGISGLLSWNSFLREVGTSIECCLLIVACLDFVGPWTRIIVSS